MKRIRISPRPGWERIAEANGFHFHHLNGELYWDESAYYQFTLAQIEDDLEAAANELYAMCLDFVAEAQRDEEIPLRLKIPEPFWGQIAKPGQSLYGRFDFSYDGIHAPKLLEFNADTPTSLYEASYFQWLWLEDQIKAGALPSDADQFNSIHERLCGFFAEWRGQPLFMASMKGAEEDRATVAYLLDCALQAGLDARQIHMEDIGLTSSGSFVDLEGEPIKALFKLYPWEFMWEDAFGPAAARSDVAFLEPGWKMLLSNKGLLPLLWERHKGHPNLLEAWFQSGPELRKGAYASKPMLGREGANVALRRGAAEWRGPDQRYGREGFIGQELAPLPDFGANYPVCGVWIVAGEACGLGMREDKSPITTDSARFVPHAIIG